MRHGHHRNRLPASENRKRNSGEPQRNWADPDSLPDDVLDYIGRALSSMRSGRVFDEFGWEPTAEASSR